MNAMILARLAAAGLALPRPTVGKVVTDVTFSGPFWEAAAEHQDYLEQRPDEYTCYFIRPNSKRPVRAKVLQEKRGVSQRICISRRGSRLPQ